MGEYVIKMPDIGEGIVEVEVVAWHVQPGDEVQEDRVVADVMTDKATVEIPSPVKGRVLTLGAPAGTIMAVGSELIRLQVEGPGNVAAAAAGAPAAPVPASAPAPARAAAATSSPSAPEHAPAGAGARAAAPAPAAAPTPKSARTAAASPAATSGAVAPARRRAPGERPLASPAVRHRAFELGIELQFVDGSGPAARITHADLDAYVMRGGQPLPATPSLLRERHDEEQVPVIGLRRRIAQKMQEAKRRIPHFSYVEEIDVTALEALRAQLNAHYASSRGKLTLLPLLARALVIALRDFPQINARYDDEAGVVTRSGAVHLGIATQTDAGLMVPVLRHAEARDLWALGAEVARLAEAARSGSAAREELSGSTLTITSLGTLGGIVTTPVINHPEVAIVGVNRILERPVFEDARVVARKLMNLSSSFDHRVVDGMDAARFIQAVRALLEAPALLLADGA